MTLEEAGSEPAGLIRLNTSRMAAKALIEPHLAEFQSLYPQVQLELVMAERLANIIAIVAASVSNFLANDRWTFKRPTE